MAKVFLGVGHGGNDPGAVANGLKEAEMNLVMATSCSNVLKAHGVVVGMSRTREENDDLDEQIRECKAFNPDVAVDIHNNAGGGDGFEFIYSIFQNQTGGKDLRLGRCIESEVGKIGQNSRGAKTRKNSSGTDYFGWIRQLSCPSVIVEGCFLDSADRLIADTRAEQEAFGVAYAKGILAYFGIPYKGNGSTSTPTPPTTSPSGSYTVKITTDVLNVRKGPGTSYAVATTVKQGEVYTIVETNGNWGKLKSGAGWICLDYTNKSGSTTPQPSKTVKVGSRVKVIGTNYATGQTVPSWVKSNVYTVGEVSGDKALLNDILSWVYIRDLSVQ